MALWLVRCGQHGEGESYALAQNVVGVGWPELGDIGSIGHIEQFRALLQTHYTDAKPSTVTNWAGQLFAFVGRIALGDLIALPLKSSPAVAFGRVVGSYRHELSAPESVRHQRAVQWIRDDVPRAQIDQDLLYSLGVFMTECRISR